jgi:leader peptidase (prepilin peptidase)/N-methyltransferase
MVIVILLVVGLCLGSFINAALWRIHEQAKKPAKSVDSISSYARRLSILSGRSMCPKCKHELCSKDLIPVISWLSLSGKCRYCKKPISLQYPLVEIATALTFIASYLWWPVSLYGAQIPLFTLWLLILVGLIMLLVYDLRWMLLPNRIIYPLSLLAALSALISISTAYNSLSAFINTVLSVAIGGGIFYLLFQFSQGKWIGGGDVRLGWLAGLIVATPARSLLFIFVSSFLGSLVSLPLLANGRLKRNSVVPFGPFLIAGIIIVELFGGDILNWYQQTFIF